MNIIITGALGHIGSYIIRDFVVRFPGANIIMIDNMMTQRFSSLFNLPSSGNFKFIEADITKVDLHKLFHGVDVVVHLAAITDAAGSFGNSEAVEENNYQSTARVCEACADLGIRLVALSSTSVYGTQNEIVYEDCLPEELQPQSPYAVTKLKEEKFINFMCKEKGLKAVSCRFGTICGASYGMRFHTAVNKFCWQAVMGVPITVWSTAYEQKRPYLDLGDAAGAIAFIIEKDLFDGQLYNVLTNNLTVKNIVDMIQEHVPELVVSFVDNKIMNQLSYEVSRERIENQGFKFSGNIEKSIGDTIGLLKQSNSIEIGSGACEVSL